VKWTYAASSVNDREQSPQQCRTAHSSTDAVTQRDQQARLLMQKINDVKLERNRMLANLSTCGTLMFFLSELVYQCDDI